MSPFVWFPQINKDWINKNIFGGKSSFERAVEERDREEMRNITKFKIMQLENEISQLKRI